MRGARPLLARRRKLKPIKILGDGTSEAYDFNLLSPRRGDERPGGDVK
jgi:hypothetical protein